MDIKRPSSPALLIPAPIGQLGNRLAHFARVLALSIEYQVPLLHFAFHPYCDLFEGTQQRAFPLFDPTGAFLESRLAHQLWDLFQVYLRESPEGMTATARAALTGCSNWSSVLKLTDSEVRDALFTFGFVVRTWVEHGVFKNLHAHYVPIGDSELFPPEHPGWSSSDLLVIDGWGVSARAYGEKHKAAVLDYLTPVIAIQDEVQATLAALRASLQSGEKLIGLHVRRGDYAEWKNGAYFFSWEQYRAVVQKLLSLEQFRGARVLLCSNETPPTGLFDGMPVSLSARSAVVEMHLFAGCDALIGPPSTFTGWASFVSGVPVYTIEPDGELVAPA